MQRDCYTIAFAGAFHQSLLTMKTAIFQYAQYDFIHSLVVAVLFPMQNS